MVVQGGMTSMMYPVFALKLGQRDPALIGSSRAVATELTGNVEIKQYTNPFEKDTVK